MMPPGFFSTMVIGAYLGGIWVKPDETQTKQLTATIQQTYKADAKVQYLPFGGFFIGSRRLISNDFLGRWGLDFSYADHIDLSGRILDHADPNFANKKYHYKLSRYAVQLKGDIAWAAPFEHTQIYVGAGLGVGINKASGFTNQALVPEAIAMPNFSEHTTNAFTYSFDLGVRHKWHQHLQWAVGYQLSDWGQSGLGRASGQTTGTGLRMQHLYVNSVHFSLEWLA